MIGRFAVLVSCFLAPWLLCADAAATGTAQPGEAARACLAQSNGYLNARLGYWQQRLNLADWKLSLVMSHASELKPKTLGNIHWDAAKKTAVIRVLFASDYKVPCREALPDMEMTLVHELVHLELSSLPRSPASRHDEELAVNRIADALVRLDRQKVVAPAVTANTGGSVALDGKPDAARTRTSTPAPTW
ncbi:MAG: hypothetical protein ABSC93_24905 [Bryobacteraceae bacterium]|jgi:hypothetical protein